MQRSHGFPWRVHRTTSVHSTCPLSTCFLVSLDVSNTLAVYGPMIDEIVQNTWGDSLSGQIFVSIFVIGHAIS